MEVFYTLTMLVSYRDSDCQENPTRLAEFAADPSETLAHARRNLTPAFNIRPFVLFMQFNFALRAQQTGIVDNSKCTFALPVR